MVSTLFSADGENEPDVLSILGASCALMVSDIPFGGPVGALRVGRINGQFVANPTNSQMENSDIDLVYAGIAGKAIMIEGRSSEVSEEDLRDAMLFADTIVCKQIEAQKELAARVNKPKYAYTPHLPEPEVLAAAEEFVGDKLFDACSSPSKLDRQNKQDALREALFEELTKRFTAEDGTTPDLGLIWETMMALKYQPAT